MREERTHEAASQDAEPVAALHTLRVERRDRVPGGVRRKAPRGTVGRDDRRDVSSAGGECGGVRRLLLAALGEGAQIAGVRKGSAQLVLGQLVVFVRAQGVEGQQVPHAAVVGQGAQPDLHPSGGHVHPPEERLHVAGEPRRDVLGRGTPGGREQGGHPRPARRAPRERVEREAQRVQVDDGVGGQAQDDGLVGVEGLLADRLDTDVVLGAARSNILCVRVKTMEILLDPEDEHWRTGKRGAGLSIVPNGYARTGDHRYLHRLVTGAKAGECVDHKNRNRLDNRRENLRLCTHAENCRNQGLKRNNTSGYKGIRKAGNRWVAQLSIDGKNKYVGIADSRQAAHELYMTAALRLPCADFVTDGK